MKKNKVINPELVDRVEGKDISLSRYYQAIPSILLFQIVTKFLLTISAGILTGIIEVIVEDSGVVALTNMDLPYLFRSWQGICVLLLGLIVVTLYTIFDINAMILISDNVLHRKKQSIWTIVKKTFSSLKLMMHPCCILILLYVVLIAPLTFSLVGVELTESFYIPDFIQSVIDKNAYMSIPYYTFLIAMGVAGFFYVLSFQFMILRQVNIAQAMKMSRLTMKKYWRNFIKRYGLFFLKWILFVTVVVILLFVIPSALLTHVKDNSSTRFWAIFVGSQMNVVLEFLKLIFTPFQIMELNRIYESYTFEDEGEYVLPERSWHLPFWMVVATIYAVIFAGSYLGQNDELFDYFFPQKSPSQIVAHRAGGSMANENTILGLEAAIKKGVYGAEIDIQRTKDGQYIVYHDDYMDRLCDVDKMPSELTMAECKKLRVKDTFNLDGKSTELATFEEMLDGAKDRIHLFIELKGATADSQMVEDAYQMIKERDMIDQVTVISLKYDLIYEMETKHPEIRTGYLCFISLGDVANLKCDDLLLEDEMATSSVIEAAHENNKKVYIWTVNTEDTLKSRMIDESDGVITDEVIKALAITKQVSKRDDLNRVLDTMLFDLK